MKTLLSFLLSLPLFGASIIIDSGSPTDQYFSGGLPYTVQPAADTTLRFSSSATTPFSYNIPVPQDGPYIVTLNFLEPSAVPPARAFSVTINDQLVYSRLTMAGYLVPFSRSAIIFSSGGFINIRFDTLIRSAVVSSIQIDPLPATPVRERIYSVVYDGNPVKLPEPPQPATSLKVFWGALFQPFETSNYITNWDTVMFSGWPIGDRITFIYFY